MAVSTIDIDGARYTSAVEAFRRGAFASCIDAFLELSERGNACATLYAATIFDRGGRGVDRNWERARALYKQSLGQAYLPGSALGLAMMYYQGRGGDVDYRESARCFRMLHGNAFAEIMLGVMSLEGHGCIKSEVDALSHFDRAWSLGHPLGLKNASIVRFKHGKYIRAMCEFIYGGSLIIWNYGVRKLPIIKSPYDDRNGRVKIKA